MRTLIIALNPAVDAEWRVDEVLWEEKNNIRSERRWPGGKGINVARWLKHLGGKPRLLLPLGGLTGREISSGLRLQKLPAQIVAIREATRVNVVVTSAKGGQIRFNPLGPKLSRSEWYAILKAVAQELPRAGLMILSGSLPRGVPITAYAQLIRLARHFDVKTLVDCDGPAFAAAVKVRPFLVKPNEYELAQWWGRPLRDEKEVVKAANALSQTIHGWVMISRGAKKGFLVSAAARSLFFAKPPRTRPRNTVGAGDAMLAAVVEQILLGNPPELWLRSGISVGTLATVCQPGKAA